MYTYPHHNDDCVYVWGGNFNIAPTSVIHIEASSMLQSLALHSAPDVSPMWSTTILSRPWIFLSQVYMTSERHFMVGGTCLLNGVQYI